jgi:hypothetical protein
MAKNTHLTHIEDRIITDGQSGGREAIAMLKYMGDFLSGKPTSKPTVTEKWDGAPAVICGTNPENGQFFVGTKSVFARLPLNRVTQTKTLRTSMAVQHACTETKTLPPTAAWHSAGCTAG